MLTGKMTATWLILITMVGVLGVPLLIIYFHSILPYYHSHPNAQHLILGSSSLIPNVSIMDLITNTLI